MGKILIVNHSNMEFAWDCSDLMHPVCTQDGVAFYMPIEMSDRVFQMTSQKFRQAFLYAWVEYWLEGLKYDLERESNLGSEGQP